MNIYEKYLVLTTTKDVRSLEVRSPEWRFCMLRPDRGDRVEVVRANALNVLVDHLISDGEYVRESGPDAGSFNRAVMTRTQGAFVAADVLQMELIAERPDRFMGLSEAEVYAVTADSENNPVGRYDIRSWKAALPLVVVRAPHTGHRVPDGNVVVIDASTDRTLLRSLAQNKIVLVFEDGRPFI